MCLTVIGCFVASTAAAAPIDDDKTLGELRIRQAEERLLSEEAAFTSSQCQTNIAARINWSRSSSWPGGGKGIAKSCDAALSAVEAVCRGGKAAQVREKVKTFECSGDGSGPSLQGTTLKFGAQPGSNGFDATRAYLDGKL